MYSDFKIHHLLGDGGHVIVETERVFFSIIRRKHVIPLTLLLAFEDHLVVWTRHFEVDIEGAA